MIYIDPYEEERRRRRQDQQGGSPMQAYNKYSDYSKKFSGQQNDSSWMDNITEWINGLFGDSASSPNVTGIEQTASSSGSGSSSAGSSGSSAGGAAGYILAAILAQMAATNSTDTKFEGQNTGNVFSTNERGNWSPSFATEPWLGLVHDKLGWEPTEGEKFDAAMKNADQNKMFGRGFGAADYWADPIRHWLGYSSLHNVVGNELATILDPIGGLLARIGEWF